MTTDARPALERILERIRVRLIEYASYKGMKDRADDVAQETLIVLFQKYSHISTEGDLVPLAYRICRLKIYEAVRDLKKAMDPLDDDRPPRDLRPSAQTQLEQEEFARDFKTALGSLSERCKTLFRLRMEDNLTADIAKLMNVPEGTIYVWEHRCRKTLFEMLS